MTLSPLLFLMYDWQIRYVTRQRHYGVPICLDYAALSCAKWFRARHWRKM